MLKNDNNYSLLIILLIGLFIRLAYSGVMYANQNYLYFVDDLDYISYARQIIEQGLFVMNTSELPINHFGPGLPWIMALIIYLFGDGWLPFYIINSIISTIHVYLIFLIARNIYNNRVAILAAAIASIYILFIFHVPEAGKEIWTQFLFTASVYSLIKSINDPKINNLIIFVLSFSLLVHLDERYMPYMAIFILLISITDYLDYKKKITGITFIIITLVLLMTPWTIRNYKVYGKPILISKRTEHITDKLLGNENKNNVLNNSLNKNHLDEIEILEVISGERTNYPSGRKISDKTVLAIKNGLIPRPLNVFEKSWKAFRILWQPFDIWDEFVSDGFKFHESWSLKHNLSVFFTYGVCLILMPLSLYRLIKSRSIYGYFFLCIFILHTIIHVFIVPFATDRYRIPIDAIIIVLASQTIYLIYNKYKKLLLQI